MRYTSFTGEALCLNGGYFDFVPVPSGPMAVALATFLVLTLVTSSLGWSIIIDLDANEPESRPGGYVVTM